METQRQSKSGSPALRSFELDSLAWWKRSGIWIVLLLLLPIGFIDRPLKRHDLANLRKSVSNARQIGLALSEFERQYGSYPDAASVAKIRKQTDTDMKLGTASSNEFFRQLLALNIAPGESMFYANISGTHKPDNDFAGAKALAKGECGFTYFLGASKYSNPKRPVAVTPMIPGTDRFDRKPFDGKAVVLWSDTSVSSIHIRQDGCAILGTSALMETSNPVWGGEPPVVVWPEL